MIPSNLCVLVSVLSSLAAANGAIIQRDGTFTYLTPQPTLQAGTTTTSSSSSGSSSQSSSTTTSSSTMSSTSPSTTSTSIPFTTSTSASSTVSATVPSTTSTTTSSAVSLTFIPTPTSSTTPIKSSSTTSSPSTTPTVTTTTQTTMLSTIPIVSSTVQTTAPLTPTVTTATATSTATPGTANCNGVQNWQSAFAYTAGDQVIFNGQLFTAKQWTYNNTPSTHPDQWTAVGTCAQPVNNQANCNGVAAWQSTVAYTAGNRVTFHGHLWSAVQWTQSNAPGDASGSWKDLGACA